MQKSLQHLASKRVRVMAKCMINKTIKKTVVLITLMRKEATKCMMKERQVLTSKTLTTTNMMLIRLKIDLLKI